MTNREITRELLRVRGELLRMPMDKLLGTFTTGEIYILRCLIKNGGPINPKALAQQAEVSSARIAAVLNGMEKKGWTLRRPDPKDRRQTLIEITKKGEEVFDRNRKALMNETEKLVEKLGREDALALLRIQRRMLEE